MIIKKILGKLGDANSIVSKIIRTGKSFKTIAIGLKKEMIWGDHETSIPTTLIVIAGSVIYRQGESTVYLGTYDNLEIPVDIIHSLEAAEESICILIQG